MVRFPQPKDFSISVEEVLPDSVRLKVVSLILECDIHACQACYFQCTVRFGPQFAQWLTVVSNDLMICVRRRNEFPGNTIGRRAQAYNTVQDCVGVVVFDIITNAQMSTQDVGCASRRTILTCSIRKED